MNIEQIQIENFRILKKCTLDMRDKTTLLVGKNNTGKTSFAVLLEKFLSEFSKFNFSDFPLSARSEILNITNATDVDAFSIRLIMKIAYSETDDLSQLSAFMLDLDSSRRHVNILMESRIDQDRLIRNLPDDQNEKEKFIINNLGRKFLETKIYAFDDTDYSGAIPYYLSKRDQLEEKDKGELTNILNFQVIHARRNVASSEDSGRGAKPLSAISTKFFKKRESGYNDDDIAGQENVNFARLRTQLAEIDVELGAQYEKVFGSFLKNSGEFLELGDLKVVSNIQSQTLIENSSQVIYGDSDNFLPENYNGLGYLNILYLLLQIELCREEFSRQKSSINLLVIEEPEAHTHPQMQYVFADKIRGLISDISNLQAIITTHSPHIISRSDFEDIRYLLKGTDADGITLKNFHTELKCKYEKMGSEGQELFKFLKQYLTINSAELFFASKVIFIEGTTERILLPWFIQDHDKTIDSEKMESGLSSQNITVLEVGANAKAFEHFLEFIGVKTLIITDIDTTRFHPNEEKNGGSYKTNRVENSTHTSNATLKHFHRAPGFGEVEKYKEWHGKLIGGELEDSSPLCKVVCQTAQNEYHARSFEDAFVSLNLDRIKANRDNLNGLKNKEELDSENIDFYELTDKILDKKSDFAASILYSILTTSEAWEVPQYIKEGMAWIHKQ